MNGAAAGGREEPRLELRWVEQHRAASCDDRPVCEHRQVDRVLVREGAAVERDDPVLDEPGARVQVADKSPSGVAPRGGTRPQIERRVVAIDNQRSVEAHDP
jgi:hypothetical protein